MLRAPIRRAASYPGQLPVQADSSDGAPGAVGASAGPAARAGQVTLVAGEMVNRKPNVESLASAGVAGPAPQLQVTTVTDWDTAAISVLADPTRHVLFGPAFASVCRNCRSRAPTTPSPCPPGQGFPGLSPFTVWTIDFTQQANAWIDLSTIRTVRLTFTGTFR